MKILPINYYHSIIYLKRGLMKIGVKSYSNIISLINSIIFFILGAIIFTKPEIIILFISYVIGGIIIIIGVFKCIKNYLDVKKDNNVSSREMITGIVLVIIGLVFILLAGVIEALVRLVIGGWILFSGINRLINSLQMPKKNSQFIIRLILSILLIGVGLYTILESNLAFKTIGLVLMIYSILEIIGYVFNRKDIYQEEIIINKKDDKIIDVELIENKKLKKKKTK